MHSSVSQLLSNIISVDEDHVSKYLNRKMCEDSLRASRELASRANQAIIHVQGKRQVLLHITSQLHPCLSNNYPRPCSGEQRIL